MGEPAKRLGAGQNPFWRVVVWIVVFEMFERMCYYTINNNAVHVLMAYEGFGTAHASAMKSAFSFIGYGSSLFWGIMADTVLGRKRTLLSIGAAYAVFAIILAVSFFPHFTHHVEIAAEGTDSADANPVGRALYLVGFYGVALCMGGIKANVASLGADQFDDSIPEHVKYREVFFTVFYLLIQAGGVAGGFLPSWMQQDPSTVGYIEGYFTAAGVMVLAVIIFLIVYRNVYSPPVQALNIGHTFSAFLNAVGQKIICRPAPEEGATKANAKAVEVDVNIEEECLLKDDPANWMRKRVAPKYGENAAADAFQISRIIPFWICMICFSLIYDMQSGVFIQQGEQLLAPDEFWNSSTQAGIADGVFCFFLMSAILYLIKPYVFDRCLGWELTPQRRIMLSTACAVLAMAYAAVLEIFRKKSPIATNSDGTPMMNSEGAPVHDMSNLQQLPVYFIVALGESFLWPAAVEFFYTEMPADFKAIGQGCFQLSTGLGALLNMIVALITGDLGWIEDNLDDGHLEYTFFLCMIIAFLAWCYSLYAMWLYARSGGRYEAKIAKFEAEAGGGPKTSNKLEKSWSQRSLHSVASRASLK